MHGINYAPDVAEVGEDLSIGELAELIRELVGYKGGISYDTTKPDGTPRKLLDVSKLRGLGWEAKTPLRKGIEQTYGWFLNAFPSAASGSLIRRG